MLHLVHYACDTVASVFMAIHHLRQLAIGAAMPTTASGDLGQERKKLGTVAIVMNVDMMPCGKRQFIEIGDIGTVRILDVDVIV